MRITEKLVESLMFGVFGCVFGATLAMPVAVVAFDAVILGSGALTGGIMLGGLGYNVAEEMKYGDWI